MASGFCDCDGDAGRRDALIQRFVSLVAGVLFGAGLAVSGMIDPSRVRGFLDLFGNWDPTLAFVMGGAIVPLCQTHHRAMTEVIHSL